MPDPIAAGLTIPELPEALAGGQPRPILIDPDPMLRQVAAPAGYLTGPQLHDLARDMLASMYLAGGRGLAGPQIGVSRRIVVMDAGWKDGAAEPLVLLDPEIQSRSEREEAGVEECLSIPDQPVEVTRAAEIVLAWYDLDGRRQSRAMDGPAARIAQHELDHLDGRLIVDFL